MTQVTEADRDAVKAVQQRYLTEGIGLTEILWEAFAHVRGQAVQEAVAELKPWRDVIDEALVCAHIGTADSLPDAKTALHKLICWEIDVALDPRVSDRARGLVAERDARIEGLTIERDFLRETADLHAARIVELEARQRGILEWLAHECGINPDDLPSQLAAAPTP